jgi:hypothetical protein
MQEHWFYDGNGGMDVGGVSYWSVRRVPKTLPDYPPPANPLPPIPPIWTTTNKPWFLQNGFICCSKGTCSEHLLKVYDAFIPKWLLGTIDTGATVCADSTCLTTLLPHQAYLPGVTACQQNLS